MKLLNHDFFENLIENAKNSPRQRSNANLHSELTAAVQRLFIAMEPDSYVRPHRHTQDNKWEFFYIVKGQLLFFIFSPEGVIKEKILLSADGDIKGLEIPPNVWHSTIALVPDTIFFEVKEGPYIMNTDKNFAAWSPPEGDENVTSFMKRLINSNVGESIID